MDSEAWMKTILDLIIMVIGIPGNLLIILVYSSKQIKLSAHVLIIGLGVSDFIVCLTRCLSVFNNVPELTKYKDDSVILCKIQYFLKFWSIFSSVFLTTCIAVDRYFVICKPFGHVMTFRSAKLALAICMTLSFIFSLPPLVLFGLSDHGDVTKCSIKKLENDAGVYIISGTLLIVGSLSPVLIVCLYLKMAWTMGRRNRVSAVAAVSSSVQMQNITRGHAFNFNISVNSAPPRLVPEDCEVWVITTDWSKVAAMMNHDQKTLSSNKTDCKHKREKILTETHSEGASPGASTQKNNLSKGKHSDKRQEKYHVTFQPLQNERKAVANQHIRNVSAKLTKMLLVIVSVFIATWAPSMITTIILPWERLNVIKTSRYGVYMVIIFTSKLFLINHAINPVVYGLLNQRFRIDAVAVMKRCFSLRNNWYSLCTWHFYLNVSKALLFQNDSN